MPHPILTSEKVVLYLQADQNRINRNQLPLYGLEGRFERTNEHPVMFGNYLLQIDYIVHLLVNLVIFNWAQNAGSHSFSIGVTEVLNTNLLIELRADDIEFVYQR